MFTCGDRSSFVDISEWATKTDGDDNTWVWVNGIVLRNMLSACFSTITSDAPHSPKESIR